SQNASSPKSNSTSAGPVGGTASTRGISSRWLASTRVAASLDSCTLSRMSIPGPMLLAADQYRHVCPPNRSEKLSSPSSSAALTPSSDAAFSASNPAQESISARSTSSYSANGSLPPVSPAGIVVSVGI